jgi:hypothetical protein
VSGTQSRNSGPDTIESIPGKDYTQGPPPVVEVTLRPIRGAAGEAGRGDCCNRSVRGTATNFALTADFFSFGPAVRL